MYKAFEFRICLEDRTSMGRIMTGESWSGFKGRGQEAGMRYSAVHCIALHCATNKVGVRISIIL
jgi:hypothetical protein